MIKVCINAAVAFGSDYGGMETTATCFLRPIPLNVANNAFATIPYGR